MIYRDVNNAIHVYKYTTIDTHIVTVSADWYITKSWSIGAAYIWHQYDPEGEFNTLDSWETFSNDDTGSSYALSTSYWWQMSQSFAVKFNAAKQSSLDDDDDADGYLVGITVNGRF